MILRPAALTALAVLIAMPTAAAAQTGNPLSSIFNCQAQGNRQAGGAAIGAVLGGIVGNQVADNERGLGTVLGAAAGAAAGSYIGCRMQVGDQQRAQASTQDALNRGENASWSNPQTGASGRIEMVATRGGPQAYDPRYDRDDRYDERRDDRYGERNDDRYGDRARSFQSGVYDRPLALDRVRFAARVQPQRAYYPAYERYSSARNVNLRAGPATSGRVLGQLRAGSEFDVLARVRGQTNDWLLVGLNGVGVGYVSAAVVQPIDDRRFEGRDYATGPGAYDVRTQGRAAPAPQPLCRTFDEHMTTRDGQSHVQRYTACRMANGEWVVQS